MTTTLRCSDSFGAAMSSPSWSSGVGTRLGNQRLDAIAQLSANTRPVLDPVQVKTKALFLAASDRIEEAQAFDITAVARLSAIRYDDVIERLLFCSPRDNLIFTMLIET